MRTGVPDRDSRGEDGHRLGRAPPKRDHDLCVLRRRLLVQGRDAGRRGSPYGSLQRRRGERRSFVREGPLRLGLRDPQRAGATPMVRERSTEPWRAVSWQEAISYAAERLRSIQDRHGSTLSVGSLRRVAPTKRSSSCRRWCRAAFGNNNVDTCARVCHSPTGFGLKQTFGTSAGTQDFKSVDSCDVIVVIGANPTEAHPVFASRMKRRIREGAKLIVIDPRRTEIVRSPHVEADYHLQLHPGPTWQSSTPSPTSWSPRTSWTTSFVAERCEPDDFANWAGFISCTRVQPRGDRGDNRCARRGPAGSRAPVRHRRQSRPSTTASA